MKQRADLAGRSKNGKIVPCYATDLERERWDQASRVAGLSRSAWMRSALNRQALSDLRDSAQHIPAIPTPIPGRRFATNLPPSHSATKAPPQATKPEKPPMTLEERAARRARLTAPRSNAAGQDGQRYRDSDGLDEPQGIPYEGAE